MFNLLYIIILLHYRREHFFSFSNYTVGPDRLDILDWQSAFGDDWLSVFDGVHDYQRHKYVEGESANAESHYWYSFRNVESLWPVVAYLCRFGQWRIRVSFELIQVRSGIGIGIRSEVGSFVTRYVAPRNNSFFIPCPWTTRNGAEMWVWWVRLYRLHIYPARLINQDLKSGQNSCPINWPTIGSINVCDTLMVPPH